MVRCGQALELPAAGHHAAPGSHPLPLEPAPGAVLGLCFCCQCCWCCPCLTTCPCPPCPCQGDCNTAQPGIFDPKGRAKWSAWNAKKGERGAVTGAAGPKAPVA